MQLYLVLSRLLDYPDVELVQNLADTRALLDQEPSLKDEERAALEPLLQRLARESLLQLQADYVASFDINPDHSLHLTHHVFGESRERGPALVDLSEHYRGDGLDVGPSELPDHLPLILEYLSTVDEQQAAFFLHGAVRVLETLAARLEQAGSDYAPLLRLLERRAVLTDACSNLNAHPHEAHVAQR